MTRFSAPVRAFALGLGLVAALGLGRARAQENVAAAEKLFDKGLVDMQAGKYETGCPAIGESYRLDPRPGSLFTLAECWAKAGKIASAIGRYDDYLRVYSKLPPSAQAKQKNREQVARKQKAALGPLVPELTITLPGDAPSGTRVKRDGVGLAGPSLGVGLPVDPGNHVITAQAPGGPKSETTITIARGEKMTFEVVVKPGSGDSGGPSPPLGSGDPQESGGDPPAGSSQNSGSPRKTVALVVGGMGVASLAVGSVLGILALGDKQKVDTECDATTLVCTHEGKLAVDSARFLGTGSTIGFVAGAMLIVVSGVLLITLPSSPAGGATAPKSVSAGFKVGPSSGSLILGGSF